MFRAIVSYFKVLRHKLEHCRWSTIAIGYRLIESYQPTRKRLSIDLLEINLIERYAVVHVFLKGKGVANICIYMYKEIDR